MTHNKAQKRAEALAKRQRKLCAVGTKQHIRPAKPAPLAISTLPIPRRPLVG